jgi:hypothetical protein
MAKLPFDSVSGDDFGIPEFTAVSTGATAGTRDVPMQLLDLAVRKAIA